MINAAMEAKYRIKPDVLVHSRGASAIFTSTFGRWVKDFDIEPWILKLLRLLHEGCSISELQEALPQVAPEEIITVLQLLEQEGIITSLARPRSIEGRYARQLHFLDVLACCAESGLDAQEMQEKIRNAKVLVIGIGGAGTHLLQMLTQVGVGRISIVDPDIVELHNLNRQVLYQETDIGTPKVDACRKALRRLNPDVQVVCHRMFVKEARDIEKIILDNHIVVSCADQPTVAEVAQWVSEACMPRAVPHIVGGSYGANFGVPGYSVIPGATPCWDCAAKWAQSSIHSMNDPLVPKQNAGSFAPIVSLVSSFIAWETIRIIAGCTPLLAGCLQELDVMTLSWHISMVDASDDCSYCCGAMHDE